MCIRDRNMPLRKRIRKRTTEGEEKRISWLRKTRSTVNTLQMVPSNVPGSMFPTVVLTENVIDSQVTK